MEEENPLSKEEVKLEKKKLEIRFFRELERFVGKLYWLIIILGIILLIALAIVFDGF